MYINNYEVINTEQDTGYNIPTIDNWVKLGKIKYNIIHSGFDIETTKGENGSYMYHWQFSILKDKTAYVYVGRTWETFTSFLARLEKDYNLSNNKRIYVWVHNLSYEWSWLKTILNIDLTEDKDGNVNGYFMTAPRRCLKAVHNNCIEFRDSLAITNCSLDKVCKKIFPQYIDYPKHKDDLDYSIKRNSQTPMTDTELEYCNRDVLALTGFSIGIYEEFIKKFHKIPLTQCQMIIDYMKKEINEYGLDVGIKNYVKVWNKAIKTMLPTREEYSLYMQYLFRGGWTGSDISQTNVILNNYMGVDETSAYPYVMLCYKYPMGGFIETGITDIDEIEKHKHSIIDITLYNIKSVVNLNYIAKDKCINLVNALSYNGKVEQAGECRVIITEIELKLIFEYYSIEEYKINSCKVCDKSRHLPAPIITNMLHFYKFKKVKKDNSEPYEYEKAMTNINYGAMVKRVRFNRSLIDSNAVPYIEINNKAWDSYTDTTMLNPIWGCYITAYARVYGLFEMAIKVKSAYSDTDSIKCVNNNINKEIIASDNKARLERVRKALEYYNINKVDWVYYEDLGQWDIEYTNITRLATLGAKRYCVEYLKDGEIKQFVKIAGLPTGSLEKQSKEEKKDIFELFLNNKIELLNIKNTTEYIDCEVSEIITDNWGNSEIMTSTSCVSLVPVDFNLDIKDKDFRAKIKYYI